MTSVQSLQRPLNGNKFCLSQLIFSLTNMKTFLVCLFALLATSTFGQVDYNRQYTNAKELFKAGKYNLAMESFKPLIPYDQNNRYSEYASFYYALAAYHQGYKAVAKDMFNQIR